MSTDKNRVNQGIANLIKTGWQLSEDQNQICRDYNLSDFKSAFALMALVAEKAEAMNHHPDWSNSYNRLKICLTTHSVGTITVKDLDLAEFIELQARTIKQTSTPQNSDQD